MLWLGSVARTCVDVLRTSKVGRIRHHHVNTRWSDHAISTRTTNAFARFQRTLLFLTIFGIADTNLTLSFPTTKLNQLPRSRYKHFHPTLYFVAHLERDHQINPLFTIKLGDRKFLGHKVSDK
jgi:hypothetical protein